MWQAYIGLIEQALVQLSQIIADIGIPYSFGFAIILFTLVIKGMTYPLTAKQIKTARMQQEIQPKLKALQEKYKGDREAMAQAQMALYKEHGINPMGGCLPMLIQMPIWMGLYRALYALARLPNTPLKTGFLWIPSLAGPVDLLSDHPRSIDWLLPADSHFLGWSQTTAYLVLPIILIASQYYTQKMLSPPSDPSNKNPMGQITLFMPLMLGYFSLVVPSALTLYWITSNVLALMQQFLLRKHRKVDQLGALQSQKAEPQLSQEQQAASLAITKTQSQVQAKSSRRARAKAKRRKRKKR